MLYISHMCDDQELNLNEAMLRQSMIYSESLIFIFFLLMTNHVYKADDTYT